jgi:hypothetical protein
MFCLFAGISILHTSELECETGLLGSVHIQTRRYLEVGNMQCRTYSTAFYRDPLSIEGAVDEDRFGQEVPSVWHESGMYD